MHDHQLQGPDTQDLIRAAISEAARARSWLGQSHIGSFETLAAHTLTTHARKMSVNHPLPPIPTLNHLAPLQYLAVARIHHRCPQRNQMSPNFLSATVCLLP